MPEWICKASHVFVGFLAVGLAAEGIAGAIAGAVIAFMFWRYEVNEEKNLKVEEGRLDSAYEEIREFLYGGCAAAVVVAINHFI